MKENKRIKKKTVEKKGGGFRENIEMLLEVFVFVYFIQTFLLQTMGIPTPSMENNMLIGDHLLVDKVAYARHMTPFEDFILPIEKLDRRMKVVFKSPPEIRKGDWERLLYVKRVIGLPGEVLRIENNQIYIDGRPIDESYLKLDEPPRVPVDFPPQDPSYWWNEFPPEFRTSLVETEDGVAFLIPEEYYFCMGDNRNISADSRIWGPVHRDLIVGKPWRNYWSFDATTEHYLDKNPLEKLAYVVIHFITRTRWERTLKKY